jgi:cell division protein FtsQ
MDWEDDPPAETPTRRVQQVAPRLRKISDRPGEAEDADEEGVRPKVRRTFFEDDEAPSGPWWRPASTLGRSFLALSVLTVLGAVSVGGLELKKYLEQDNRFRIAGSANIQASGLSEVSRAELLPVFGADIGKNVFFVHLDERRRELEAIPWVERATVMRVLPDQLRVTVTERKPVAFTRAGQQIGLVDADGVLLTMPAAVMAERHYSFPVVTGLNPADPPAARRMRMAVYTRLMAELDANHQRFSDQISEIDLTDPEDARAQLQEQGTDILVHFGDERFLERYRRYKAHIADWRQQYPQLTAVDLRYEQQAVLKMGPAAPASTATTLQSTAPEAAAAVPSQAAAPGNKPVAPQHELTAKKSSVSAPNEKKSTKKSAIEAKSAKITDKKSARAVDKKNSTAKDRKTAAKLATKPVAKNAKGVASKGEATGKGKTASHQKLTQAQKDLVEKFRAAQQKRHAETHAVAASTPKSKPVTRAARAQGQ